jgi:hypothetical protein
MTFITMLVLLVLEQAGAAATAAAAAAGVAAAQHSPCAAYEALWKTQIGCTHAATAQQAAAWLLTQQRVLQLVFPHKACQYRPHISHIHVHQLPHMAFRAISGQFSCGSSHSPAPDVFVDISKVDIPGTVSIAH